jgi:hypothetical protein
MSEQQLGLFDAPAPAAWTPVDVKPGSLRETLTSYASSDCLWESLAQHGATDSDLADFIASNYYTELGRRPKPQDCSPLIAEVRALFGIPAQKLDVTDLPSVDLIKIAQEESQSWHGSGRSPLHDRVNEVIDLRGEKVLTDAGWPIHDGAPYVNRHNCSVDSYADEADKHLDSYARARGESRGTNTKYIVEHCTPMADPAIALPDWEKKLAALEAVKPPKPKKGKTVVHVPFELTEARKTVELLKAEIARRAK